MVTTDAALGKTWFHSENSFVGGNDGRALLVAAGDDLEEQVGVARVVGQVAELVEDQERRTAVVAQAASERGRGVLGGQVVEHGAGGGEACGVPRQQSEVGEIFGDDGLAGGVGANEHDVGGLRNEVERAQFVDRAAVNLLRPLPVEVAKRLEGAEPREAQAAIQGAALTLALLVVDHGGQPIQGTDFIPVRE